MPEPYASIHFGAASPCLGRIAVSPLACHKKSRKQLKLSRSRHAHCHGTWHALRAYLLQFDRKLLHTLLVFLDHLLDLLLLLDNLVPHFQLTLISVAECV